jgi:hypothetical protein
MTTAEEKLVSGRDPAGKGLAIALNGINGDSPADPSSSPAILPNGTHSHVITNGSKLPPLKRPPSPLKEVSNTLPSRPSSSASQRPSTSSSAFKIPFPPKKKPSLDRAETFRPRTPQLLPSTSTTADTTFFPKARRWSSYTNTTLNRRNSFPTTRKDSVEALRALRAEAKLRRRKTSNPPTAQLPPSAFPSAIEDGPLTSRIPALVNLEYATRHRTLTNPGVSVGRKSSHVSHVPPRLETLRRDTSRGMDTLPSTLWDYLMIEMDTAEVKGVEEYKKERLYNFLRIPEAFERVPPFLSTVLMGF